MTLTSNHAPGTLVSGVKTVASTGTPEALGTGFAHVVDIQAHSSNTASLTIGASTVVHGTTTQAGVKIDAGETWTFYDVNLAQVFIDVGVNGEGVGYVASTR